MLAPCPKAAPVKGSQPDASKLASAHHSKAAALAHQVMVLAQQAVALCIRRKRWRNRQWHWLGNLTCNACMHYLIVDLHAPGRQPVAHMFPAHQCRCGEADASQPLANIPAHDSKTHVPHTTSHYVQAATQTRQVAAPTRQAAASARYVAAPERQAVPPVQQAAALVQQAAALVQQATQSTQQAAGLVQ